MELRSFDELVCRLIVVFGGHCARIDGWELAQ